MNLSSSRKLAVVLHLLSKLLFVFFRSNDLGKSISTKHNLIKENMHLTGFKRPVSVSSIQFFLYFSNFHKNDFLNISRFLSERVVQHVRTVFLHPCGNFSIHWLYHFCLEKNKQKQIGNSEKWKTQKDFLLKKKKRFFFFLHHFL